MDTFGVFGLMGFVMAIFALEQVKRLERILRENNIRPGGTGSLGGQLRAKVGKTVDITLYESGGSTTTSCKVLDVDEEWARVLRNERNKTQRERLTRLADVNQIKS